MIRAQKAKLEQILFMSLLLISMPRNSRVWRRIEGRARRVVNQAALVTERVVAEKADMFHYEWGGTGPEA